MNDTPLIPGLFMVDDNFLAAEALKSFIPETGLLRWLGWSSNPVAAVPMIVQLRPDLVLLDVEIPGVDCFAALRALTAQCPSTRVVMFSGHAHAALIDRSLQEGAAGYIVKDEDPLAMAQLLVNAARGECVLSPTASSVYMRAGRSPACTPRAHGP